MPENVLQFTDVQKRLDLIISTELSAICLPMAWQDIYKRDDGLMQVRYMYGNMKTICIMKNNTPSTHAKMFYVTVICMVCEINGFHIFLIWW